MNQTNQTSIDDLDFDIMTQLIHDGRKSLTDIARSSGVSVATARNRLARLINEGIFFIYGRVDPNRVGFNSYAHIYISVRPARLLDTVAAQIAAFPEVTFLAQVAGEYDLEVNVMCRDNNHLLNLMNDRLLKLRGVDQTRTAMYLRLYKVAQADLGLLRPGGNRRRSTATRRAESAPRGANE